LLGQCADGELLRYSENRARSNRDTARRDLFAYIEGYYNRQRRHSAIGYITPEQAEAKSA
jgi:transposase InsO family protein